MNAISDKPASGRSRWKTPALFLAAVLALGAVWYAVLREEKIPEETAEQIKAAAGTLADNPATADDAVDLAIKTVSLSQGEGGFELWRLKAEWANLRKRDDTIIVEQPRLTYNMREEGKVLFVESHTGDINQKTQVLRFIEDVRVTQESKIITGGLLVYDGNDKTMTFPQGCLFTDTGVSGSVNTLVWHIDRQIIEGEGDVKVVLEGSSKSATPPAPQAPDDRTNEAPVKETP